MSTEKNPDIHISEVKGQQDEDNGSTEENEFKVPLPAKVLRSSIVQCGGFS